MHALLTPCVLPVPVPLQSIAPQLFAFSLFPYLAFLFFLTKTDKVPKLTLIGFYFLLAFVFVTIPAGIYGEHQLPHTSHKLDIMSSTSHSAHPAIKQQASKLSRVCSAYVLDC